jgi:serine/threonine-protein kinase
MTDEVMHQLSDALADRYLLEDEIGRGSAATVYLAQDLRHGRLVALKVLHSALGQALGVERFQREIRTQARLHHPHILPLFDSGAADDGDGGRLFYVMPFVESGSLRDRLVRRGPLSVADAVKLAQEVASALAYAHGQGVIHRDLKPENILLTVSGHALLTDFGIAYAVEESRDSLGGHRLTETGVTLGTPAYMSPEQSAGDEIVDARSDVYSLATVLWEGLAGRPPFEGPNARAIMARRLTEAPPSVAAVRADVPEVVARALTRALSRHPEDRFESAEAFAAALAPARPSYHDTPLPFEPLVTAPTAAGPPAPAADRGRRRTVALGVTGLVLLVTAVVVLLRARGTFTPEAPAGPPVVAVLPFKNLGAAGDQYFADGLTEEITSRLAGLTELRVISRTSADQFRASNKSVKEIGGELGADYVLEGSVRWSKADSGPGRLRVTPQLIRVADDSHRWATTYDATLGEVFRLQSDIAEQVTTALDVALRAPERAALASGGTRNSDAYDFYLRGVEYVGRTFQEDDLRNAQRMFEQAIAADPTFAQAYARLSRVHAQIYWHFYDRSNARLEMAKQAADTARALAPDLPETHIALGFYHYWGSQDYDRALREFELARRQQPGNGELLGAIGYVERRRGRWQESLARFVEALRYDPRSARRNFDVADNYFSLHMFSEAEHYFDRAMILSPDWGNPYIYKAWMLVSWRGDTAAARAVLRQGMAHVEGGSFAPGLAAGDRVSASLVTGDTSFNRWLDDLSLTTYRGDTARYHVFKAEAGWLQGRPAMARGHGDSAIAILEPRVHARPTDAKLLELLSRAYAYTGRRDEAVRSAERAVQLLPVDRDAVSGPYHESNLARVYMMTGHPDRAIAVLEGLLKTQSWITPAELRVDPIWGPLRSFPRFRVLSAELQFPEAR